MIPPARYDVPLIRVLLTDSSGNPVTGLTSGDANMRIGIARDNGGAVAVYGGSNILSIATIGTYVDPGSSAQCRFGAVDATNFPGLYEIQFNQSFLSSARSSYVVRVWDLTATPRWQQTWCAIPIYMPTRVDHVRDTLQTSRDLGAQLDVAVSTRSTLTAADVWGHATRTLTSFGTLASDVASAVWSAGTRTLTSFGTLVSDVWSAATRTLTSYADSSGVTTLLSRIVGTLAAGTHQPQSGDAYARIGAGGSGLTSLGDTRLSQLDAAVSSRAPASDVTAIKAKTDQLTFSSGKVDATLDAGVRTAVAGAVWDEPLATHQTTGSAGAALATAGSGGIDPALADKIEDTHAMVQTIQSETIVRPELVVGGVIRVARGYDYGPSSGRTLAVSSADWPDLTDALEVRLCERNAARTLVKPMVIVAASPTGAQTVRVDFTAAETAAMIAGVRPLRVAARLANGAWVDLADVELAVK
jgi:hypothetical protein